MRPEIYHEGRTRTRSGAVMTAVVLFHVLLILLMALFTGLIVLSVAQLFLKGRFNPSHIWKFGVFVYVAYQAFTVKAPVTDSRSLIDLQDYPRLAEALSDAALRVNAEVPEAIRLTAGPNVRSFEEGGVLGGIFGARRLLVIGAAAAPYLSDAEFRSLLARALARWSKHETWYGMQALRVEMASQIMIEYLGSNWARVINPFYWLFVGFRAAFGRTLAAYRRERELWADQMAAQAYTAADAESAIKKEALYTAFWTDQLEPQLTSGRVRTLQQVWAIMSDTAAEFRGWMDLWQVWMGAREGALDLEPSLGRRLEALAASREMPAPAKPAVTPATGLLTDEP